MTPGSESPPARLSQLRCECVQALVVEQGLNQEFARFLAIDDARKEQLFLLAKMPHCHVGEEAHECLRCRDRLRTGGCTAEPSRLDQRSVVIVRERNQGGMTLHLSSLAACRHPPRHGQ
jgi:hypothetical protein